MVINILPILSVILLRVIDMAKKLTIVLALLAFSSPVFSGSPNSQFHLRLLDRLDRPEDGYCIDILGTPGNLRIDVPLFAHNCSVLA